MMTPCRKLYYAVEAVVYIAYNNTNYQPICSKDIANVQGLPPRHLEQIMQRLVHGGVLRGMRGPKGGYTLAKPAQSITVSEICTLVNEEDIIAYTPPTTNIGNEIVRPFWTMLKHEIFNKLDKITIAELCTQANEKNLPRFCDIKQAVNS